MFWSQSDLPSGRPIQKELDQSTKTEKFQSIKDIMWRLMLIITICKTSFKNGISIVRRVKNCMKWRVAENMFNGKYYIARSCDIF